MTLRPSAKHLLPVAAILLLAAHAVLAQVPSNPGTAAAPDRSSAYYHDGLAHLYEEMAVNNGRPDYAAQAIEEYKLALNADPTSKYLQDGLADLYFKIGRIREAVTTAQEQVKKDPSDLAAHVLLGKVYLRSLNDMQGPQANDMLQLAIGEYEQIAKLQAADLETHLILGQLYGLNHDSAKAEAQFKLAREIDSNSEEAVLAIARLYTEQGEPQRAIDVLSGIPESDRSARIDFILGASYDELHKSKEAAKAYRAALDDDPDNPDTERALASALLADNQLDDALVILKQVVAADPSDVQSTIHISEIQRRQGHYDEALITLNKAKALNANSDNLELSFNEAVLYDSLGKYDKAIETLQSVLAGTAHADGKYSDPEKSNRAIFLDRLGIVYREQGNTQESVDAYKQMIALGGEYVLRGYDGEIDSYRDAHQWKEAVATASQAAQALPKDKGVQLMYAFELADTGQVEKGLQLAIAQLNGTPGDRDTNISIANIDIRLHRSADAMARLDKADALSTKPDEHGYIDMLRATILDHDKQYDQAEAFYRKALEIDPNNATVLNDFGYMQAERGVHLSDALAMIQKAVTLDPQNGAFLDSLGWVQYKLGQYGPAEENLHKAIDRTASDPSIHDHLGEVYEKTGRLQLAVAQWERSMTEYARSLPADADPADVAKVKRKLEEARTKLARNGTVPNKKS
jgi:tetratricopeptide (TPR) repeat protein